MTDDFKTNTDIPAPSDARGGRENLDTAKIRANMQGPPEQASGAPPDMQETPEDATQADKDTAEMEAALQAAREQRDKDLIEMRQANKPYEQRALMADQQRLRDVVNGEVPVDSEGKPVADAGDRWEDRGIIDVPVAALPQPEGINGPQDFNPNKFSYDDAVAQSRRFQEMKPQIDNGLKSDDFADLDRKRGLDYAKGQQRVYDLFYGSDPVTVMKDGNKYDIDKGRHRIFVAKEAGYDTIPARVREKVSG